MPSRSLVVRPITPAERARFDQTLEAEHWLGAGLVGEVMRYVAEEDGEWCALLGFGSAALCVRSREELLGWSDAQRHRRLRYVTNNQRFCVLEGRRRANLASEVLGRTLSRLSADFEARWRHPVIAVETFTDPSRHLGTCYKASSFMKLGVTSGYGRRAGRFVHHGTPKAYWLRTLRKDATRLLGAPFDHPALDWRRQMRVPDLNRLDLSRLLDALAAVPDPRRRRGVRHQLPQILAIAVLATLRGATSLFEIGEIASELPEEALERLSCRISPSTGRRIAPEESTIRRMLHAIDAEGLDRVVNAFVASQVAAGRMEPDEVREVAFSVMVEEDETEGGSGMSQDEERAGAEEDDEASKPPAGQKGAFLPAIAVDGKALRGARLDGGRQVHLLSALTLAEGVTVAQRRVETKTNEITAFAPMLAELDLEGVVVTADALHAQRDHARFLVEEKGAHFVLSLKGNQPSLASLAELAFSGVAHEHSTRDKAHGRIEHRHYAVVKIGERLQASLNFPYARSIVRVYRERYDLKGTLLSSETSYYLTDLSGYLARVEALAYYIRGHWGIENRSHHVRDVTFDEDRCQVRKGGAPQVLATLRNLTISILRLVGFKNVAAGCRWAAWDHRRALPLLGV